MTRDDELRKAVKETVENIAPVLAKANDVERKELLFLLIYSQVKGFDDTNLANEEALLEISKLIAPENIMQAKDILNELRGKTT